MWEYICILHRKDLFFIILIKNWSGSSIKDFENDSGRTFGDDSYCGFPIKDFGNDSYCIDKEGSGSPNASQLSSTNSIIWGS